MGAGPAHDGKNAVHKTKVKTQAKAKTDDNK
jgi:hypothetical protein